MLQGTYQHANRETWQEVHIAEVHTGGGRRFEASPEMLPKVVHGQFVHRPADEKSAIGLKGRAERPLVHASK